MLRKTSTMYPPFHPPGCSPDPVPCLPSQNLSYCQSSKSELSSPSSAVPSAFFSTIRATSALIWVPVAGGTGGGQENR